MNTKKSTASLHKARTHRLRDKDNLKTMPPVPPSHLHGRRRYNRNKSRCHRTSTQHTSAFFCETPFNYRVRQKGLLWSAVLLQCDNDKRNSVQALVNSFVNQVLADLPSRSWELNVFFFQFINENSRIICQAFQLLSSFKHFIKHSSSAIKGVMPV